MSFWRGKWPGFVANPHQLIEVGKEFLSRFPHYAERNDIPSPTVCGGRQPFLRSICKRARRRDRPRKDDW